MVDTDRTVSTRRDVLAATGVGLLVGVAGCTGNGDAPADDGGNGTEDGSDRGTDDRNEETGDSNGEANLGKPVAFPEDVSCPVCNMMPAEYPKWNAQLAHTNGDRAFFDTSGCLAAYTAYTDRFGGPDADLEAAWVTGFETGDLLRASDAYFVRVTDPDHVDDVMMRNPTPFADRGDAEAFVEEFDAYGDGDIITFEDFDKDLAMFYRERFIQGDGGMDGDMDMDGGDMNTNDS
ncbi:nitrous oxide reductase accessory protein NosL [Natronomonas salsuginis]|uniref:Nitrous oxide reductase accessory protein NosL n=1 Tax=Natronomonas salsuginis TaxID=2217661 RepID=A0A4U5JJ45_9EURY|nr:nitrous oxide reductase accessory protein NosL [Natronomonas salsuginis]TKR27747.1 hypothetical protein DM868_01250 [Natronomonas salsuginis]